MAPASCRHCGTAHSPLWRRGLRSEVLCNACGLYWRHHGRYRPLAPGADGSQPGDEGGGLLVLADGTRSAPAGLGSESMGYDGLKPPAALRVARSSKKASRKKSRKGGGTGATVGGAGAKTSVPHAARLHAFMYDKARAVWRGAPVFPEALPPTIATADVRLVPMDSYDSAPRDDCVSGESSPVCEEIGALDNAAHSQGTPGPAAGGAAETARVKYTVLASGKLLLPGDHVAVRGDDGGVYYAVVRDFWRDADGVRRVELQWLLPRPECPENDLRPTHFWLGPVHKRPEMLDCAVVDVFFSPLAARQALGAPWVRGRRALAPAVPYDPYKEDPALASASSFASDALSSSGPFQPEDLLGDGSSQPRVSAVADAKAPMSPADDLPAALADAIRGGAVSLKGTRRTTLSDSECAALSDTEVDANMRGRPIPGLLPGVCDVAADTGNAPGHPGRSSGHFGDNALPVEHDDPPVYRPDMRTLLEDVEIAHALCAFF